ncbi:MAG: SUMF1/EgtB/PvdO family nonheme iron enzyme [Marinoscillum sp.]
MKNLFNVLLCSLVLSAFAISKPESIPSKLREVKANNWYLEKYRAWEAYLIENPNDKSGWVECFKAAQYSGLPASNMTEIVNLISEKFAGSPESYWVKARLHGWTVEGAENLKKAVVNVDKNQWITDRIMLAELKGLGRSELTHRLNNQNVIYPSLLNYSYNVLMSVGENGFLITEGENTTLPIWVLQDVMQIREDVKVLNMDLLQNQEYRERKLSESGLSLDNNEISSLPISNPDADFYFALTLPKNSVEELEDQLYVVGLTSFLSPSAFNNYDVVKQNIEDKFLLDYLTVDFNGEPKTATGRSFETNYIVPFYILKQYYDQSGNTDKSAYWEDQIRNIASRSQIAARVNMLLSKSEKSPRDFKKVDIEVKKLDKRITKVKDNIYASIYEVTNAEYLFFLNYLKENGYEELYEQSNYDLSDYDEINKAFAKMYHYSPHKTSKEDFTRFPTMDVTFESANLYCEWLTTQYNAQEAREFKKVKFRLPSRNEWTMAALGYVDFQSWVFEDNIVKARPQGDEKPRYFEKFRIGDYDSVSYPWYHSDWYKDRNKITNQYGCYLANIKTPEEVSCKAGIQGDGFTITSPVGTYFSNDMGLFDVIGNVAEMINEPGKAMGGSWGHIPQESTITSINEYDTSDNKVGFRIFMEVIEE